MTAISRTSELVLAVLLAATPAAADTVITVEEVIPCSIELADPSFINLRLPQGGTRILNTRDVQEVRIPDSNRVVEIAARLPQLKVTLDSGQAVAPSADRAHEMLRLHLERAREAYAKGFPEYADMVDTLPSRTSSSQMSAKCRDMDALLRLCGRNSDTVALLLRHVNSEQEGLRSLRLTPVTTCLAGMLGGGLGGIAGGVLGLLVARPDLGGDPIFWGCGGGPVGTVVGCAVGSVAGVAIDLADDKRILKRHRGIVNDMVRRVNMAVVTAP